MDAIDASEAVVVLLSSNSVEAPYIHQEIGWALKGKFRGLGGVVAGRRWRESTASEYRQQNKDWSHTLWISTLAAGSRASRRLLRCRDIATQLGEVTLGALLAP